MSKGDSPAPKPAIAVPSGSAALFAAKLRFADRVSNYVPEEAVPPTDPSPEAGSWVFRCRPPEK